MLLKKTNKATPGYLITLALQSRGDMIYVGPNTKNEKKCFANLFTKSEAIDNGHWKFHQ